jgi:hypothetical protein
MEYGAAHATPNRFMVNEHVTQRRYSCVASGYD